MIDINRGFLTGPFLVSDPDRPLMKASPCSCIEKAPAPDGTLRKRIIHDLSAKCGPFNESVNESINKDLYSPNYEYLSQAISHVKMCGPNSWQAILDVQHAYSNLSVNANDRFFLGLRVGDLLFCSGRLVFGCVSSPFLYGDLANAVVWIARQRSPESLITAYVDDHHFVNSCNEALLTQVNSFKNVCAQTNLPLETDKELVSQRTAFLGVVIDTVTWTISLKPTTLAKLRLKVDGWLLLTNVSLRDIMEMLGNFLWASVVFLGGGSFSTRLMDTLRARYAKNPFAKINFRESDHVSYIRLDLLWWKAILDLNLPGRPISDLRAPASDIFTDACPSGIGAWY
jgi:hypothetical protein